MDQIHTMQVYRRMNASIGALNLNSPSFSGISSIRAMTSSPSPSALLVERVPALNDNYMWLLHVGDVVAVVDPAEHEPVVEAIARLKWPGLTHILNTHHHGDHVGANLSLKQAFNLSIIGPAADKDRIPGIDSAGRYR